MKAHLKNPSKTSMYVRFLYVLPKSRFGGFQTHTYGRVCLRTKNKRDSLYRQDDFLSVDVVIFEILHRKVGLYAKRVGVGLRLAEHCVEAAQGSNHSAVVTA
jgi:hypothetical protein